MHTDTNASIKYLHEYHEYKCERNANLKNTCLYVCYQKPPFKTMVYMQNNCAVGDREYDWLDDTEVQSIIAGGILWEAFPCQIRCIY